LGEALTGREGKTSREVFIAFGKPGGEDILKKKEKLKMLKIVRRGRGNRAYPEIRGGFLDCLSTPSIFFKGRGAYELRENIWNPREKKNGAILGLRFASRSK